MPSSQEFESTREADRRHFGNRHGRSQQAREAVLHAADGLLAEVGFAALTIEGIAARAGVAKQTIYRWWSSKTDVLMDALLDDVEAGLAVPDTGSLRDDLREYLERLAEFLSRSDAGAVFRALSAQAQLDPTFARRFRDDYLARQREQSRIPLLRAIERRELDPRTPVDAAIDQLVGPIFYRVMITGETVDVTFTDALVDTFMHTASQR